ncbi:flavin reductase family protein [Actibacterium lipolyticum]|uniref:FMN reductase (NADH) NtaB n=1 Tax=Actibacterium lipolyticum TaxID=1524263 RepID=A0A238KJ21_9RHOB|nr:flavin reductase family protein [Actibacterium lipolyticum]SMX42869.1 FMN reductase (NADH) NtaB [Actibacterium lipolyticum]
MKTVTPGPGSERSYRDALGRFATGVTVVTTAGPDGPMAITANSFSSLSLDPPLVLWAPAKSSRRYQLFCDTPRFAIHVLADDQLPVALHFARTGHDFAPMDWEVGPDGLPLLRHFAARFDCTRHDVHDGGDHAIVVGRVNDVTIGDADPLVFANGEYGRFSLGL